MPPSKKAARNWKKNKQRASPKAKEKAKKAEAISRSHKLKDLKRQGSEAVAKAKNAGKPRHKGILDEIETVEDLFASIANEEEQPKRKAKAGRRLEDSESDSEGSAGAFVDVPEDGDDDDDGDFDHEQEEFDADEGAIHEEELRAMQKLDPKFYEFLVQQDKALLEFRSKVGVADELDDGDDGEEQAAEAGEDEEEQPSDQSNVLTKERFQRICEASETSRTAFRAAVNALHVAVLSIKQVSSTAAQGNDEYYSASWSENKMTKKKKRSLLHIEDEEVFSLVIEWGIANLPKRFMQHAGKLKKPTKAEQNKARKKSDKFGLVVGNLPSGAFDATRVERWNRLKFTAMIFFEEVLILLNNLKGASMLEFVLRSISTPEALSWLWPLEKVRGRIIKRVASLWSSSSSHDVRLMAFLVIRNTAVMGMHFRGESMQTMYFLEDLLRLLIKCFAAAAERGYTWRSVGGFRFMENSIIEMLKLEDATAYRVAYACIRQLAVVLRSAALADGKGVKIEDPKELRKKAMKNFDSAKSIRKKEAKRAEQSHAVVSWPFVRAIYLWTKAVSSVPFLRPLAYPLSMIVTGAVKRKSGSMATFPFIFHCMNSLNKMADRLEAYVPIGSYALKALSCLLNSLEKSRKEAKKLQGKQAESLAKTKRPDLEVLIRFSEGVVKEPMSLEAAGSGIIMLLTDHLGMLGRSPAFPEVSVPVLRQLRRLRKHCPSESVRRQLKTLLDAADASVQEIQARRESLSAVPDWKKFYMLEADTSIAKARTAQLQRIAAEEKLHIEAILDERRQEEERKKRKQEELAEGEEGQVLSKRALRKIRAKEEKKEAERLAKKAKRDNLGEAVAHKDAVDHDVVEEMRFESDED